MFVIRFKKYFIILSILLVLASVLIIVFKGFNLGIEFTGGTIMELSYKEIDRPDISEIHENLRDSNIDAQVQEFGEDSIIIRTQKLEEKDREKILSTLTIDGYTPKTLRLNSIGPTLGDELRNKAYWAVAIVIIAIILFVAFAFRSVSKPVSSWKYGIIAMVALIHDITIPLGIWALFGFEMNSLFVVGLLSILGLSVNDTIVVFDRIRENLKNNDEHTVDEPFSQTVGNSLRQTVARSIFTSLTLLVVLVALFIWGPIATWGLVLVLIIGTIVGTYSSIFLASPLLVLFAKKE